MDTLTGIDTSNLNGHPASYVGKQWYQDASFVIAQAIPRGPATTAEQLYAARDQGKHPGSYTWLWDDPNWRLNPDLATDQRIRWGTVPDDAALSIRPFIDSEDNQSTGWRGVSVQQRKDNLLICLDVADTFAARRQLPPAGVYISTYYINLLYAGWTPPGRVLWLANYSMAPGSIIGGAVVGHQFTSSPIDKDILLTSEMLESEIIHHGGNDPMLQVTDGFKNYLAAKNDHPISDEFTFRVNSDGTVIQSVYGLQGRYLSTDVTGQWETVGPFSV